MTTLKAIIATSIAMLTLLPIAGAQASYQKDDPPPPPEAGPVQIFQAKWILPPRTSSYYGASKAFAESMGYETVEHDDFSYPPPRTP
jgi:hypothetical protein